MMVFGPILCPILSCFSCVQHSVTLWALARQAPLLMGFSGPITSWQVEGGKVEALTDFIFLGSQMTAAMKLRQLFLGRKAVTNLDSILKNRDMSLPTKFCRVKVMVFPVVIYRCESWTVKKAG